MTRVPPRSATRPALRRHLLAALVLLPAGALQGGCSMPRRPAAAGGAPGTAPVELLAAQVRNARYVLLGEVHDNPEHHRRRAELLRHLLADGWPTRVVFEQMDRGSDAALAAAARDAEAVADAGRLDRKGWRWPLHKPLVQAALDGGAVIAGGNFDRDFARRLGREGLSLARDLQAAVEAAPWSPAQDEVLRRAIETGHCNMLPPAAVGPMVLVQRSRDAALAQAMLRGSEPRVVLIAGNGHVRNDVGVPHYLRAAGVKPTDIVSVAFVETGDADAPASFSVRQVTPPVQRPDPCQSFKPPRAG